MMRMIERFGWIALLAVVLAPGSGCVAVNVGKPVVYKHTETVVTRGKTPVRTEVLSVEAKAQVEGNRLKAWLEADVRDEYQRFQHDETVTVKKQRRLAMGLFPGAAPAFWAPPESLLVDLSTKSIYVYGQTLGNVVFLGIPLVLGTLNTILVEPFSNLGWVKYDIVSDRQSCKSSDARSGLDTPKLDALLKFTPYEQMAMRISIRGPTVSQPPIQGKRRNLGMWGLLGLYKYNDMFVTGPLRDGPDSAAASETKQRTETVGGPYEVDLRIAGTDISGTAQVGARESNAAFILPQAEREGAYEATLTFRSLYSGMDAVKNAWKTRTLTQWVWLREKPQPKPAVAYTPPATQPAGQQVVERVVEKHYIHEVERKPEGPPYDVEKTVDGAGRTVWRVKILAGNLNAFAVDGEVKPRILRELRDDFAGRNPHVPPGEINAFATYTTEDGGRTLVYVGVAESLIPSLESLTYIAETHRGTVTMRLAGGADLRRSKEFVRANVSAIVCDKNVVLTAGERPPDGATYRSLDENYADGVLTVEFEAVE